tara:strand:- start:6020 stop:8965 length:2946 start_codon:yes stop_codon:yes gene_type:complete
LISFTGWLNKSESQVRNTNNLPPFLRKSTPWADSLIKTMTLDEKIGQLFMVAAYSNKGIEHQQEIVELITKYHIGGLIFMQGGPVRQAKLTNLYQTKSKIPLMLAIDGEWGLAMRLDSTVKYPWQMTLGAIQDSGLIMKMGEQIAEQCQRVGLQINFAPVVDINSNPKNPIINARSFGEDKINVTEKGTEYMWGMQKHHVLPTAKHFPGHGDTDADSHKTLPVLNHPYKRLDTLELYPFKQMTKKGLGGVMVAHLYVPSLEPTENKATTLSKRVVTDLLHDSLEFKGLIFTDALNMQGVSKFYPPGVVDVMALKAGNDVLLFSQDVPTAIKEIKKALQNGEISKEQIDAHCLKILRAKEWMGLNRYHSVKLNGLYNDLNKKEYTLLQKQLYQKALTVLKNEHNLLPIKELKDNNIVTISFNEEPGSVFEQTVDLYKESKHYQVKNLHDIANINEWKERLTNTNTIIASFHNSDANPWKKYKIKGEWLAFLMQISKEKKLILCNFQNAYALSAIKTTGFADAIIQAYQNNEFTQSAVAQLIFGAIGANGKLPVSAGKFKVGDGINLEPLGRLQYTLPEELNIRSEWLKPIDSIAESGIKEGAYPGCQVLVAKSGKVIYQKAFGYHTYDSILPVKITDIYDLASVTKISATVLALMKLQSEGKFSLDHNLCDYLGDEIPDTLPYYNMNIREILAHQAGLQAWVPFYIKTLVNGVPRYDIYSLDSSETYPLRVADNLWINKGYPDTIFKRILRGPVKTKEYRYSDLGYYFFKRIIEKITGESLDVYIQHIYDDIGMSTTTFKPRYKFPLYRIVPTEKDNYFRHQLIHGDVHDMGAAMMGGVGGHAGLFSNANDLAKLMQMYLNYGEYAGKRYIDSTVLAEYTKCQFCAENGNRRGAGFDKPVRDGEGGPTCNCVSYLSFGHSGFTGTLVWVDPEEEIVYVFLSNRIYPTAENKKLLHLNIRTNIQEVIYDALNKGKSVTENING